MASRRPGVTAVLFIVAALRTLDDGSYRQPRPWLSRGAPRDVDVTERKRAEAAMRDFISGPVEADALYATLLKWLGPRDVEPQGI